MFENFEIMPLIGVSHIENCPNVNCSSIVFKSMHLITCLFDANSLLILHFPSNINLLIHFRISIIANQSMLWIFWNARTISIMPTIDAIEIKTCLNFEIFAIIILGKYTRNYCFFRKIVYTSQCIASISSSIILFKGHNCLCCA